MSGPRWDPALRRLLRRDDAVIVVEAPQNGDQIFSLMKEFTKGTTSYKTALCFIAAPLRPSKRAPGEIDMRVDRYAASVAADMARLAGAQDALKDSEHSKQARAVGIVPSPPHGGRTGWRDGNSSDYAVTTVRVRTTTSAKVTVIAVRRLIRVSPPTTKAGMLLTVAVRADQCLLVDADPNRNSTTSPSAIT